MQTTSEGMEPFHPRYHPIRKRKKKRQGVRRVRRDGVSGVGGVRNPVTVISLVMECLILHFVFSV